LGNNRCEWEYSITAPQSATTLVFSYIGMKKQEVVIGGRKVLDVVMESDILGLDEVVVTAVGIQRSAKSVGYSVSTVSADKTQEKAEPDMLKTLEGKVPGVDIRVGQGAPGAASNITIRGSSSFYGSNQPLIVVDGIPYSNDQVETSSETTGQGGAYSSGLSTLDPNNIETLTVLKVLLLLLCMDQEPPMVYFSLQQNQEKAEKDKEVSKLPLIHHWQKRPLPIYLIIRIHMAMDLTSPMRMRMVPGIKI